MPDFNLLRVNPSLLGTRAIAQVPRRPSLLAELGQGLSGIASGIQQGRDRKFQEEERQLKRDDQLRKRQEEEERKQKVEGMLQALESGDRETFINIRNQLKPEDAGFFRQKLEEKQLDIQKKEKDLAAGPKPVTNIEKLIQARNQATSEGRTEDLGLINKSIEKATAPGGESIEIGPDGGISIIRGGAAKGKTKAEGLLDRKRLAEQKGDTERVKLIEQEIRRSAGLSGDAAKLSGIVESAKVELGDLDKFVENIENPNKILALESIKIPFTDSRPGRALSRDTQVQVLGALKDNLSDKIGRLRSGGAINEGEEARFLRLMPSLGDTQDTMKFKLKQMEREFSIVNARIRGEEVDPELLKGSSIFNPEADVESSQTEETLQTQAEEAIRQGADPDAVNQRLQELLDTSKKKDLKPEGALSLLDTESATAQVADIQPTEFLSKHKESFGQLPRDVPGFVGVSNKVSNLEGLSIPEKAYIMATVKHETGNRYRPLDEVGKGKGKRYGKKDPETGKRYYGRGYVQLTWKENYKRMGDLIGVDLVNNPELANDPDIAFEILVRGMRDGNFTGKKLSDFITEGKTDYRNARRIVNRLDRASKIAKEAEKFEKMLRELQ